jgi:hypothetical protein
MVTIPISTEIIAIFVEFSEVHDGIICLMRNWRKDGTVAVISVHLRPFSCS